MPSSYSKFILYIKYHPYFNIFYTTSFFSPILISTTIHYFILLYISIIFYFYSTVILFLFHSNNIVNILYESFFFFSLFFSFPPPSYLFTQPPLSARSPLHSSLSLVLFSGRQPHGAQGRVRASRRSAARERRGG
jgi:hypothetical protein